MKIRNGFVSNSSSSSFTCDVCGITESGMDASAGDFDMTNCINGHCFCNDHAPESSPMTPNQYREEIRKLINECSWLTKEKIQKDIVEMESVPDDEIEDFYNDNYLDNGVSECKCPICTFKSLDKSDGYKFLKKKFLMEDNDVLESMKVHFKNYSEFKEFVKTK